MLTRSTIATSVRTPGQRRRYRRDVLIAWCHAQGFSQRYLADCFNLARSRIQQIITEVGEGWRDHRRFVDAITPAGPPKISPMVLATLRQRDDRSEN